MLNLLSGIMEKADIIKRIIARKETVIYILFTLIFLQNEGCHGIPVCLWCQPEDGAAGCSLCTGCTSVYSSLVLEQPCTLCTKCTPCKSCTPCDTCMPCTTCVQSLHALNPCTSRNDVNCQTNRTVNSSTEDRDIFNKELKSLNKQHDYRKVTNDVNVKVTRHRRVIRSASNSSSSNVDVSSDESLDTAPSSESEEEPLDDILKEEDLFVHNEDIQVIQPEELGHDDLDIALPERGSGEMFSLTDLIEGTTAATPSDEPVTGSEWTGYDVTIGTTDVTEEYEDVTEYVTDYVTENITEYVTDYVTEDVTENVTDVDDYDVIVTIADDEFDRAPFGNKVTSSKPEHLEPGKSANEYHLTEVNIGNQEVVDSSSSATMSKTSIIITVIVIMTVCVVGVIIIVIYSRRQRQLKKTHRNGDYHPTSSEEQSREMELLNRSRDDDAPPRDVSETTPLRADIEPEVIGDLSAESKT